MKKMMVLLAALLLLLPSTASAAEPLTLEVPIYGGCLTDGSGAQVLYDCYAEAPFSVAGLSKLPAILTMAQAFDEGLLQGDAEMLVSTRASKVEGPTAFLEHDERIRASLLMQSAVMISAGDAILTLGENAYGSESVFVENINATLRLCGIEREMTDALGTGTQFTARELALLGAAALKSETFLKYCALYREVILHADGRETELVNANRLVRTYTGCTGLLTGSDGSSAYCGVFSAQRGGTAFVAAVIGAPSSEKRFSAAETMLNYAFASYAVKRLCGEGERMAETIPVREGKVQTVDLISHEAHSLLMEKNAQEPVKTAELPKELTAPLSADTPVGQIRYCAQDGTELAVIPLYPSASVEAFGWKEILRCISQTYLGRM